MSHPFQPLTAKEVAQYLSEHTDFFVDYPELTADLIIPHQQRGTVSLVELQAEQLRTQLHQQRQELAALIRNADNNEQLFQIYAQLLQRLYTCETLDDVEAALHACFQEELALAKVHVQLFIKETKFADFKHHALIDKRFKQSDFFFGRLSQNETQQIFTNVSVESCALMLLGQKEPIGLFAVGSDSATHFHPEMDTLFLLQLKQLLEQVLARILAKQDK
ncbi:MAG: Uncharacterised protein [Glaciecola sp. HTCC2999]|jgi:uncharacterized protein YigA (DUF484 family)|nr:MAG: Uncharacterised protein [Glaciecola sp. HTCC2999]